MMAMNVLCHWCISMTLLLTLPFYTPLGEKGVWVAKIVLEWSLMVGYSLITGCVDWGQRTEMLNKDIKGDA